MADQTSNNNDYIFLYNRSGRKYTIKQFIEREHIVSTTAEELFDLNKKKIFDQWTVEAKNARVAEGKSWLETENDLTIDDILPSPCVLIINPSKVTAEIAISQTNAQTQETDFYAFAAEKIQDIYQNEGYAISESQKVNPDCQVFGWFKSLYYVGTSSVTQQTVFSTNKGYWSEYANISRHIISLSTNVGANGGSFVMRLPIISANSAGIFAFGGINETGDSTHQLGRATKSGSEYNFGSKGDYYARSVFSKIEANYYNWLISSNDLLFLSFEKLDMEFNRNDDAFGDEDNFDINTAIANGVYDMIALVDEVKVVTSAESGEAYVEVTGRDLMKLLIEDGSFFFNYSNTSAPSQIFQNEQSYGRQGDVRDADFMNDEYNNPINRMRWVGGEIDIFANRTNTDLSFILKGVLSQLANVEIVPGFVFNSWGDDRTKFVDLQPEVKETDKKNKNG